MTQTEKPSLSIPPTSAPKQIKKSHRFSWGLLGIFLLIGVGSVALVKCPFFTPRVVDSSSAQITILEKRVDSLENRLNTLTEIAAANPTSTTIDDTTLAETVKSLQRQITDMQSLGAQDQRNAHRWIATAFAFLDLREAATNGRPFASQLSTFRKSLDDPGSTELLTKLDTYASSPPPTVAQLKEQLLALEPSITTPAGQEQAPKLWQRVKAIFGTLISIHPLHNPQLIDVEKALDEGSPQDAFDAYRFLSEDIQHQLMGWKEQLEARVIVDKDMTALSALFTVEPGSIPTAPEVVP